MKIQRLSSPKHNQRKSKMKGLFVDTSVQGHHLNYMRIFADSNEIDAICLLPKTFIAPNSKIYISDYNSHRNWNIKDYMDWINLIDKIANQENVDFIHFLYADALVRFCGIGLKRLQKKRKLILTLHWIKQDKVRMYFLNRLIKSVDKIIVHTAYAHDILEHLDKEKVCHIEYPAIITQNINYTIAEARQYWKIEKSPVFAVLGGTRYDKGLDLLLKAFSKINNEFALLIVGYEDDINIEMINLLSYQYRDNVYINLNNISDNEFNLASIAADCIILPYRRIFNGSSGPLSYGVWHQKFIVGPNHGSLGYIINNNELGSTFETENIESLTKTIEKYLENPQHKCNDKYIRYRNQLRKDVFLQLHIETYQKILSKRN